MDRSESEALLDTMPRLATVLLGECTQEELTELLDESKKEDLHDFVLEASDHWYDDFNDHPASFRKELSELMDWMHSLHPITQEDEEFFRQMQELESEAQNEDFIRQMQELESESELHRDHDQCDVDDEWITEGF